MKRVHSVLSAAGLAAIAGLAASANADQVNLTPTGSNSGSWSMGTGSTADDVLFSRVDYQSAGTGYIDPFVRIRHDNGPSNNGWSPDGEEQGYNTSGRPTQYDELTTGGSDNFVHDVRFGDVGQVTVGGITYLQFLLDINEPNGGTQNLLSLDQIKIFTTAGANQTGVLGSFGTAKFDSGALDNNSVLLDYNYQPGSGAGDMQMLVPLSYFAGVANSDFLTLFSYFGHLQNTADAGYASQDGFEEWTYLSQTPPTVPLPSAAGMGLAGLAGALVIRRRRLSRD